MSSVGGPGRPFGLAANLGDAGKGESFFADGHAVTDRLATIEHVIEIPRVRIDDDGAGHFLAVIIDDMPLIRLRNCRLFIGRRGEKLLVARGHAGVRSRLDGGLHATTEHQPDAKYSQNQSLSAHFALFLDRWSNGRPVLFRNAIKRRRRDLATLLNFAAASSCAVVAGKPQFYRVLNRHYAELLRLSEKRPCLQGVNRGFTITKRILAESYQPVGFGVKVTH